MSPTIFRVRGFRFFFFSREETRMHVHVICDNGEAKFWMEPTVKLASNCRLSSARINEAHRIIEERSHEIKNAWKKHFGR